MKVCILAVAAVALVAMLAEGANYGQTCTTTCTDKNAECSGCIKKRCGCPAATPWYSSGDKECLASVALDGDCKTSSQCNFKGARVCDSNKKCKCATGWTQSGADCVNKDIGEACSLNSDCTAYYHSGISTAECKSSKCACKTDYKEDATKKKCMRSVWEYGSPCKTDSECSGVQNTQCTYSTCTQSGNCYCKDDSFYSSGKCYVKQGHGETCSASHATKRCVSTLTCSSGKCACLSASTQVVMEWNKFNCRDKTKKAIDGECAANSDCADSTNAECVDKKCKCKTGFTANSKVNNFLCTPIMVDLDGDCSKNKNCYHGLACSSDKCKCTSGTAVKLGIDDHISYLCNVNDEYTVNGENGVCSNTASDKTKCKYGFWCEQCTGKCGVCKKKPGGTGSGAAAATATATLTSVALLITHLW